MSDCECDVAVIGAGTAGLAAERTARNAGARTLLIDERFAGTTCASVGCMPSKLLIAAAEAARSVRQAHIFGIEAQEPVIDGPSVMARVRKERDRFVAAVKKSIDELPEGVALRGSACSIRPSKLVLEDGRAITARALVIATGSRPSVPDIFKPLGDRVLTNETIFELPTLPKSIAVIGAGPLGLELAQALVRLGVRTEVFAEEKSLAHVKDQPVADELEAILSKELKLRLGVTVKIERNADAVKLHWTGSSSGSASFERVLVATGRPPELKRLDLAQSGLELDKHGTPVFDPDTRQCGNHPVFIAGDADADRPVLHEASFEGAIAGSNAASFPKLKPGKRSVRFSIMFTDPQLAIIGDQTSDGRAVGCASYSDQGRARVMARNSGLTRIFADPKGGRLLGAAMFGPGVEHLAHLIAWSIQQGLTAADVLALPFYHPTLEEGLQSALREICETAHTSPPIHQGDGSLPGA
jgi:dihydrolipoamide dehydrogenase